MSHPSTVMPLLARPWIELDLDGVPLGRFPQQLLDQSGLERLALTDAGITEVSPEIGRLTGLRMLNLSGNPLTALPPEIAALTRLEDLRLATTKLTALPEAVARLPALRRLDLDATKISSLPEGIGRLTALEHLGIRGTPITRLPRALTALRRLKPVDLTDVRLTDPPPEIAAEGWAAIQRYRAALDEQGETRLFEAKLVIVGEGTVGKTSLMRKLMDRAAPLASGDESHDSTRGINIVAWHLPTCKSDDFRVNVWDFGGQQIYHSTHQFFLTRRTLYLFVWDAVIEDRAEGFEYWLNVVRTLSGGSPVLMVMNKSDKRSKPIDQDGLRRSFPDIAGFHQVSAKTGAGLDDLQNAIRQHIADLPLVGTPWPNRWTALRAAVEADPRDYIDRAEYLRLCEAQGIAAADADILSGFLHDLGVILHFRDDPLLGNTVILKPRWGTDAVYAVLDSEKVRDDHGRFRNSDLGAIWDPTRHPAAKHPELLRLMERFEQCFPLEGGGNRYIVPELLSPGAPNIRWKDKGALVFEYHYTFMPAGIITRFICRTHRLIEDELFWRRGVVLTREGARARVESFPSERTIRIAIHGKTARELLAVIRDHFTHIHQTLNNLAVRQNLPCPCGECAGAEKQHFFDYDDIRRVMEKRDTVPCMISGDDVAIADLLGILGDEARRPGKPAAPPQADPKPPSLTAAVARVGVLFLALLVAVAVVFWLLPVMAAAISVIVFLAIGTVALFVAKRITEKTLREMTRDVLGGVKRLAGR